MTFLQQVVKSTVGRGHGNSVVALHKGTCTLLIVDGANYITKQKNHVNEWVEIGRWTVPQGVPRFVCNIAIEAYNCFLLVSSDANQTQLLFFSLTMKLCNICELAHIFNVVSGDFDQLRKDLVLGLKGGALLSTIIRRPEISDKGVVDSSAPAALLPSQKLQIITNIASGPAAVSSGALNATGEPSAGKDTLFQAIPRKHSRFSKAFLGTPMQVCSQDLLSTFIVLSDNGGYSTLIFAAWYCVVCCNVSFLPLSCRQRDVL
jgi:hypothetical protein